MPLTQNIRRRVYPALIACALAVFGAGLALNTADTVRAAADGVQMCINILIPSLLPFFMLSFLCVELGFAEYAGRFLNFVMRPLFNVPGRCAPALLLGLAGGYPIGAQTALAMYEKGACTKTETQRLLAFCNNSGPAFILGTVGASIFGDSRAGLLLYLTHVAASLTVGLIFRFYKAGDKNRTGSEPRGVFRTVKFTKAFTASVKRSIVSLGGICGCVVIFSVALRLLYIFRIIPSIADMLSHFGVRAADAESILSGMVELTSGLWSLRGADGVFTTKLSMAAFMLGWAGVSVHFQVISFIGKSGLSLMPYIAGKLLHAGISAFYTYILAGSFGFSRSVSSYLAERIGAMTDMSFYDTITMSAGACLTLIFCFLPFFLYPLFKKVWNFIRN